ncbi:unnamed protein product [Angiostrongylus costaricensis]|uniref:DUF7774 domain-containing protein n=1 Tax=Angiostrongylus costaricensis TaxID=334426 RepID=A0A0R3PDV1_ANGCS|nr:unnamed protein product [Angiostrongylus costaricensis]
MDKELQQNKRLREMFRLFQRSKKPSNKTFFQRARKNDVEEFETVNVTLRPAATKMRQAKLRWKCVDDKQEVDVRQLNRNDRDLAILDGAYKPELVSSPKVSMKWKKQSTHDEFDKSLDNTQSFEEEKEQTSQQEAIALRGLAIMKRNQILEQVLKPHEAHILSQFFQDETLRPNKMIVQLIDKAFGYGIEVLLMRPDLFEDVVDNELRLFMLDSAKAKRIFLDCMLLHPEHVPISWGGDVLAKRQQLHQIFTQKAASKSMENEGTRDRLKENGESRNSRTQTGLFHRKSPASKSSRRAVKDVINRSLSPTVEEEKEKTQDFDFIKADGYENEGKFLQREAKQEKVTRKKVENNIQESADGRGQPITLPTNQIPNQRTLGQDRIYAQEHGRRMSRDRKPKFRSGKRRERTGDE